MEIKRFSAMHPDFCNLFEQSNNSPCPINPQYSIERITICKSGIEYGEDMYENVKDNEINTMLEDLEKNYYKSVDSYSNYVGKYEPLSFNEHRFIFCASAYFVFLRHGMSKIPSLQRTAWKDQIRAEIEEYERSRLDETPGYSDETA
jgi:hypothetical protein